MPNELQSQYIFTTLRYDQALKSCDANTLEADGTPSAIYLLTAHFDRLVRAARAVFQPDGQEVLIRAGLKGSLCLEFAVKKALEQELGTEADGSQSAVYRVRVQCDAKGKIDFSFAPLTPLPTASLFPFDLTDDHTGPWSVVLDRSATIKSAATQHKTNDRSDYDRARQEAGILSFSDTREVLLYDQAGNVMDASITTPYFCRDGIWITPRARTGGQQGTTRSWALETCICIEGDVSTSSLQSGEVIWLSNAARGFFTATLMASKDEASGD